MAQEFTPAELEQLFGGIDWKREVVTTNHTWAVLDLAHDAYSLAQILNALESLKPDQVKRKLFSADNPERLEECVLKFTDGYVLLENERVTIVGANKLVDQTGALVILRSEFGVPDAQELTPNTEGSAVWRKYQFEYDTAITPGRLLPALEKLRTEFELDTARFPSEEGVRFLAKIGECTYLRMSPELIEIVGDGQVVDAVGKILTEGYERFIERTVDFCDTPYT